jgi:hypothetical protein
MPTFPGQWPATILSVDQRLRTPTFVARDLVNLTAKRFVADRVLVRGTPEMVAGGAMHYQRDQSIYLKHDPEQAGDRTVWPRTIWEEDVRTAAVREFGLEIPIAYTAIRRNNMPQLTLGERRLANNLVRFVDTLLFQLLLNDGDVQHMNATVDWSDPNANFLPDVTAAQTLIETQYNGYNGFEGASLVLPIVARDWFVNNDKVATRLPRESRDGMTQTGQPAPLLGLDQILYGSQADPTKAIVMDGTLAGVIADETPDPSEGFGGYDPGDNHPPIYVKVYDEPEIRSKVISGGRWPAMALLAPKAIVVIDDITPAS